MNKRFVAATIAVAAVSVSAVNVDAEALKVEEEKWVIQYEQAPQQRQLQQLEEAGEPVSNTTWTVLKQHVTDDMLQTLREDSNVKFIERVQTRQAYKLSHSQQLWDYTSLGMPQFTAPQASDEAIVVAVVDSGVDATHPYLQNNMLQGYNALDDSSDVTDVMGHGTQVAGVIARAAENYDVNILPVRVLDDDGFGESHHIAAGIRWAVDNGAHIINLSFGGMQKTQIEQEAIQYAHDNGVIVVAAAGNDNQDARFTYPASEPRVITVGAVTEEQYVTSFTNTGRVIDLVAPGQDIMTTYPTVLDFWDDEEDGYTSSEGTSLSAAFTSGVFAVLKAAYPEVSNTTLEVLVKHYATDLGAIDFDSLYGFGHVNVEDFIADAQSLTIQTTEVEKEQPIIQIDVANASSGNLVLLVGDTRYEQEIIEDKQTYTFTLPAVTEAFDVTAQIEHPLDVSVMKTQSIELAPKTFVVQVENEHGYEDPMFLNVVFYGVKNDELEYLGTEQVFEDEQTKYMLYDTGHYDKLYAFIEADRAYYIREVTGSTITATAENLVPIQLKNSYGKPNLTMMQTHVLYPYVNDVPSIVPMMFQGYSANVFIEKGRYYWSAYEGQENGSSLLSEPNLIVEATPQLKRLLFDIAHYSDAARVKVDVEIEGEAATQDESASWLTIENTLTGDALYFTPFEDAPIALTPGSYVLNYTFVDSETSIERPTISETFTVDADTLVTIRGEVTEEDVSMTLEQTPASYDVYRAPTLPSRTWTQMQLTPVHALYPWTVELSQPVDEETLAENVYVRGPFGFNVDVTLRLASEGETVLIIPNEKYVAKGTYEVIVDEQLASTSGELLKAPVRATFTVK